ncbi:uncharacterized protein JCM15063_001020 [Sporobolomyces koalae]|uniref:uncharacterized protein n=1 Tax=Sporobolomyces koalae TaxID=500713 RepID=UPI0031771A89
MRNGHSTKASARELVPCELEGQPDTRRRPDSRAACASSRFECSVREQTDFELHVSGPCDPRALPLPCPPREGEYIFPDSTGRASFVYTTSPRLAGHSGSVSPHLLAPPTPIPIPWASWQQYSPRACPPAAPKLEPARDLSRSPPSDRLSTLSSSPGEGFLFENWMPAHRSPGKPLDSDARESGSSRASGHAHRLKFQPQHGSVPHSPRLRDTLSTKADLIVKAEERIRALEHELDSLKLELVETTARASPGDTRRA